MSKLNEKQRKCLNLLKENKHSIKEIAAIVGYTYHHLDDLMNAGGNTGLTGQLFQAEYQKITPLIEARTSRKVSELRENIINRLNSWVRLHNNASKLSKDTLKQLIDALNALTKAAPSFNIETTILKTGLQGEDIVNEYRRLAALVQEAASSKRVPKAPTGGTGQVHPSSPEASSDTEDSQAPFLPTFPETREVPPKSRFDKGDLRG